MSEELLEKYNLNHRSNQSSGDDFVDWIYEKTASQAPPSNTDTAWANLKSNLGETSTSSKKSWVVWKVAAAISLLTICGYLIFTNFNEVEIIEVVAVDHLTPVNLPDGSRVILNKSSKISFPETFSDAREVTLSGEAYFDVEKDERSFQVQMANAYVSVLGTAFNLNESVSGVSVFVEHGTVALGNEKEEIKVNAGEQATYDRIDSTLTLLSIPDANIMAWRNGKFDFVDVEFQDVVRELEDYYDVKFHLAKNLRKCRVTASFDNDPLPKIIETLDGILRVEIKQEQSVYQVTGEGC